MVIPKLYWRFFVILFFSIAFCFILYHALFLTSTPNAPDTWLVGDWLINYQGGFVRRGLTGELFMGLSQFFGIQLVTLVVVFQVFVYLVFFVATCRLAIQVPFSVASFLLICSPAFMLFPILDYQGAFRKEILFFALLAFLCEYLQNSKRTDHGLPMVIVGMVSVLIVFSHEMLVAYLPYLLCAFVLFNEKLNVKPIKIMLVIIPAVIVAILLMVFAKGDSHIVTAICGSLAPNLPLDCIQDGVPGSISLLDDGLWSASDLVVKSTSHGVLQVYILTTLLGIFPLVINWLPNRSILDDIGKTQLRWLLVFVISAVLASIPLFLVASDYGRLIYIHVSSLSLLTLAISQDVNNTPLQLNFRGVIVWGGAFFFVTNWRLIHWGATLGKTFPLIQSVLKYLFT